MVRLEQFRTALGAQLFDHFFDLLHLLFMSNEECITGIHDHQVVYTDQCDHLLVVARIDDVDLAVNG